MLEGTLDEPGRQLFRIRARHASESEVNLHLGEMLGDGRAPATVGSQRLGGDAQLSRDVLDDGQRRACHLGEEAKVAKRPNLHANAQTVCRRARLRYDRAIRLRKREVGDHVVDRDVDWKLAEALAFGVVESGRHAGQPS